jgi:hypothetical protein
MHPGAEKDDAKKNSKGGPDSTQKDGKVDDAKSGGSPRHGNNTSDNSGGPVFSDPIQYGIAVTDGTFIVRTGTKVWCIRQPK